jgi:hypothetical protein
MCSLVLRLASGLKQVGAKGKKLLRAIFYVYACIDVFMNIYLTMCGLLEG